MNTSFRRVGSVLVGLSLWGAAQAQTWLLTDTRRQVWADTSYTPAENGSTARIRPLRSSAMSPAIAGRW